MTTKKKRVDPWLRESNLGPFVGKKRRSLCDISLRGPYRKFATSLKEPSVSLDDKVLFPTAHAPGVAAWMPAAGMLPHAAFCRDLMPETTENARDACHRIDTIFQRWEFFSNPSFWSILNPYGQTMNWHCRHRHGSADINSQGAPLDLAKRQDTYKRSLMFVCFYGLDYFFTMVCLFVMMRRRWKNGGGVRNPICDRGKKESSRVELEPLPMAKSEGHRCDMCLPIED